jgi:hypothetical protein
MTRLRDKLKLGLYFGFILACWYGMLRNPYAPAPDPETIHRQLVAMPNYWIMQSPPLDPSTDEPDFTAPLWMWGYPNVPGFWTAAACEQRRDAMIANEQGSGFVQKELRGMAESYRCIAKDDMLRNEGL